MTKRGNNKALTTIVYMFDDAIHGVSALLMFNKKDSGIGQRARMMRERKGWSQQQLAERIPGVRQQSVDQLEQADLHNRMPVILPPDTWSKWLGESEPAERDQLKSMLVPYAGAMVAWPVSARVGNVKNNDASLIEPIS